MIGFGYVGYLAVTLPQTRINESIFVCDQRRRIEDQQTMGRVGMEREHLEILSRLRTQLGRVILGKPGVIENVIIALLSGGHILVEDVPGVGKTTLAKSLAKAVSADFKRVQFTPDLLPTDILGSSVYNPAMGVSVSSQVRSSPTFCSRMKSTGRRHARNPVCWKQWASDRPLLKERRTPYRHLFWSLPRKTPSNFMGPIPSPRPNSIALP